MEFVITLAIVLIALSVLANWLDNDSSTKARRVPRSKQKGRPQSSEEFKPVYDERLARLKEEQARRKEVLARREAERRARTEERWARLEQEQELRNERRRNRKLLESSQESKTYGPKEQRDLDTNQPSDYSRLYGKDSAWN